MLKALAEETSLLALRINSDLDRHLAKLQTHLEPEEFRKLRSGFGLVMGYLWTDVAAPIYAAHPDLKPVQLGGPYVVPPEVLGEK